MMLEILIYLGSQSEEISPYFIEKEKKKKGIKKPQNNSTTTII